MCRSTCIIFNRSLLGALLHGEGTSLRSLVYYSVRVMINSPKLNGCLSSQLLHGLPLRKLECGIAYGHPWQVTDTKPKVLTYSLGPEEGFLAGLS